MKFSDDLNQTPWSANLQSGQNQGRRSPILNDRPAWFNNQSSGVNLDTIGKPFLDNDIFPTDLEGPPFGQQLFPAQPEDQEMAPQNDFSFPNFDSFAQGKGPLSSEGSPGRRRGDSGFFNNDFMIQPPGFDAPPRGDPFQSMHPEIPPNYGQIRSFEPPSYGQPPAFGQGPSKKDHETHGPDGLRLQQIQQLQEQKAYSMNQKPAADRDQPVYNSWQRQAPDQSSKQPIDQGRTLTYKQIQQLQAQEHKRNKYKKEQRLRQASSQQVAPYERAPERVGGHGLPAEGQQADLSFNEFKQITSQEQTLKNQDNKHGGHFETRDQPSQPHHSGHHQRSSAPGGKEAPGLMGTPSNLQAQPAFAMGAQGGFSMPGEKSVKHAREEKGTMQDLPKFEEKYQKRNHQPPAQAKHSRRRTKGGEATPANDGRNQHNLKISLFENEGELSTKHQHTTSQIPQDMELRHNQPKFDTQARIQERSALISIPTQQPPAAKDQTTFHGSEIDSQFGVSQMSPSKRFKVSFNLQQEGSKGRPSDRKDSANISESSRKIQIVDKNDKIQQQSYFSLNQTQSQFARTSKRDKTLDEPRSRGADVSRQVAGGKLVLNIATRQEEKPKAPSQVKQPALKEEKPPPRMSRNDLKNQIPPQSGQLPGRNSLNFKEKNSYEQFNSNIQIQLGAQQPTNQVQHSAHQSIRHSVKLPLQGAEAQKAQEEQDNRFKFVLNPNSKEESQRLSITIKNTAEQPKVPVAAPKQQAQPRGREPTKQRRSRAPQPAPQPQPPEVPAEQMSQGDLGGANPQDQISNGDLECAYQHDMNSDDFDSIKARFNYKIDTKDFDDSPVGTTLEMRQQEFEQKQMLLMNKINQIQAQNSMRKESLSSKLSKKQEPAQQASPYIINLQGQANQPTQRRLALDMGVHGPSASQMAQQQKQTQEQNQRENAQDSQSKSAYGVLAESSSQNRQSQFQVPNPPVQAQPAPSQERRDPQYMIQLSLDKPAVARQQTEQMQSFHSQSERRSMVARKSSRIMIDLKAEPEAEDKTPEDTVSRLPYIGSLKKKSKPTVDKKQSSDFERPPHPSMRHHPQSNRESGRQEFSALGTQNKQQQFALPMEAQPAPQQQPQVIEKEEPKQSESAAINQAAEQMTLDKVVKALQDNNSVPQHVIDFIKNELASKEKAQKEVQPIEQPKEPALEPKVAAPPKPVHEQKPSPPPMQQVQPPAQPAAPVNPAQAGREKKGNHPQVKQYFINNIIDVHYGDKSQQQFYNQQPVPAQNAQVVQEPTRPERPKNITEEHFAQQHQLPQQLQQQQYPPVDPTSSYILNPDELSLNEASIKATANEDTLMGTFQGQSDLLEPKVPHHVVTQKEHLDPHAQHLALLQSQYDGGNHDIQQQLAELLQVQQVQQVQQLQPKREELVLQPQPQQPSIPTHEMLARLIQATQQQKQAEAQPQQVVVQPPQPQPTAIASPQKGRRRGKRKTEDDDESFSPDEPRKNRRGRKPGMGPGRRRKVMPPEEAKPSFSLNPQIAQPMAPLPAQPQVGLPEEVKIDPVSVPSNLAASVQVQDQISLQQAPAEKKPEALPLKINFGEPSLALQGNISLPLRVPQAEENQLLQQQATIQAQPEIAPTLQLKIPIPEDSGQVTDQVKATPKRGRKPKGDKPPGQKRRGRKERKSTAKELEIAKAESIDIQPNTFSAGKGSPSVSFQSPKAVGNFKITDDQEMGSPVGSNLRRKSLFSITKFDRQPSSRQINPFDELSASQLDPDSDVPSLKTPKKRKSRGPKKNSVKGEGLLGVKRQLSDLEGVNLDETEAKLSQLKVSFQLAGQKKEEAFRAPNPQPSEPFVLELDPTSNERRNSLSSRLFQIDSNQEPQVQPSEGRVPVDDSKSPNQTGEGDPGEKSVKKRVAKASRKSIVLKEGEEPKPKRKYVRRNTIDGSNGPKRAPKGSRRDLTGTISSSGNKASSRPQFQGEGAMQLASSMGLIGENATYQLVACDKYQKFDQQPYRIYFTFEVQILMFIHSYLSKHEVIGLLGGRIYESKITLRHQQPASSIKFVIVNKIYPAESCAEPSNRLKNCEIQPTDQARIQMEMEKDGVQKVGWYHSHPVFEVDPSIQDLYTHNLQQSGFDRQGIPFFGVIIGPYSAKQEFDQTLMNVFNLKDETTLTKQAAKMENLKDRGKAYQYKIIPRTKLNYQMYDDIKKMVKAASLHKYDKPVLDQEWRNQRSRTKYIMQQKFVYSLKKVCETNVQLQAEFNCEAEIKDWLASESDCQLLESQLHMDQAQLSENASIDQDKPLANQIKKVFSISDTSKISKFLYKIEAQLIRTFELKTKNYMGDYYNSRKESDSKLSLQEPLTFMETKPIGPVAPVQEAAVAASVAEPAAQAEVENNEPAPQDPELKSPKVPPQMPQGLSQLAIKDLSEVEDSVNSQKAEQSDALQPQDSPVEIARKSSEGIEPSAQP